MFKFENVVICVDTFIESVDVEFIESIFPFREGRQNSTLKRSIQEVFSSFKNYEEIKVALRKRERAQKVILLDWIL